jgi:N-acetylglucosaminyldiphosphoundecaprenol N-acetyl-beta-D-mannosaminyltransferase
MDTNVCWESDFREDTVELLNINFHVLNQEKLNFIASGAIARNDRIVVGHHNLHSLYLCQSLPYMVQFYKKADYIHIDGMSIIALGNMLGRKLKKENRLTSLDWLLPLLQHCQRLHNQGLRVFLLGGQHGVAEVAGGVFKERVQGLEVDSCDGYFDMHDAAANDRIVAQINRFRPHLLLVGMGMPRQEQWILCNADKLESNVVWSLGAFMDYYAGIIPVPPRWMGAMGLEWAYRLYSEPRRLWKRYLVEPWLILSLVAKHYLLGGASSGPDRGVVE